MITTKLTLKLNSHLYVLHVVPTTCSYKKDTYYNMFYKDEVQNFELQKWKNAL